ncbi:MAG: GTPase Era [Saprospiraceae bacterium]|nr:GTPase Era [Saprospiraceae bacterium]MBK8483948.1 GTPase Era [Saprospiraceae bacterium]MBK9221359.1 GTPase Era [Saprospiraceae bacterium]MBK9728768.1 GTPase Era [Saprospiraceae bacterium]
METVFRSGFVNLVGLPNSGKSTLINALTGEKMAIISPKPQTTRQRILGFVNDDFCQIIFSDTPGFIDNAAYPLHLTMNMQVKLALEDADLLLLVIDSSKTLELPTHFLELLNEIKIPILFCLNKIDKSNFQLVDQMVNYLQSLHLPIQSIHKISALNNLGLDVLYTEIKSLLPKHPAYFPDDLLSNRPLRFFLSEMIREQIYKLYDAEIPYHCFVVIERCKGVDDKKDMAVIDAHIYVGKQSQVPILIGKNGSKLKELGTKARLEIEHYLNQKVYLSLSVKLRKDWRDNTAFLNKSSIFQ